MSGGRVILEKLSAGSPSLEVTRHLVAQHTKINNNLKDTTPRQALIEADGILDQLQGQNAFIKSTKTLSNPSLTDTQSGVFACIDFVICVT